MSRGLRRFCALAGVGDAATGVLLVTAPRFTLGLLGIAPPSETIWIRFVGVFVATVGLSYLLPLRSPEDAPVRTVLATTALVRGAVCAFLAGAVGVLALPPEWLVVAGYDGALALAQAVLLTRGTVRG